MTKSPSKPLVIGFVASLLSAFCWLLVLPPADTSQWSEKMWSVHRVNHFSEDLCMIGFALLAVIFFAVAFYRWLRYRGRRDEKSVA